MEDKRMALYREMLRWTEFFISKGFRLFPPYQISCVLGRVVVRVFSWEGMGLNERRVSILRPDHFHLLEWGHGIVCTSLCIVLRTRNSISLHFNKISNIVSEFLISKGLGWLASLGMVFIPFVCWTTPTLTPPKCTLGA